MKRSKLVVPICLMLLIPITVFIFNAQNMGTSAAPSAREASLEKSPEDEELKKNSSLVNSLLTMPLIFLIKMS